MDNIYAITSFKGRYSFLSNFHEVDIHVDDIIYPSVEHAFQASKTGDKSLKHRISIANSPGEAKRLGKSVSLIKNWDDNKLDTMRNLLIQKFQNPELKSMLIETNQAILIEGDWWSDLYWGCMIKNEFELCGQNNLGKLLMEIRQPYLELDKIMI